jgi:hypothetical protein
MITATILSIPSRLLKALRWLLLSLVFSLLFLQLSVGSAMAQPSPEIDPSQRPPIPALPLEKPALDTRDAQTTLQPPDIPQNNLDTAKRDRPQLDNSSGRLRQRPADPYKPYYDSIEKFNEEVYGEKG